jgi:hypothetical protein
MSRAVFREITQEQNCSKNVQQKSSKLGKYILRLTIHFIQASKEPSMNLPKPIPSLNPPENVKNNPKIGLAAFQARYRVRSDFKSKK